MKVDELMSLDPSVEGDIDRVIKAEYDALERQHVVGEYHVSTLTGFGFKPEEICYRQAYFAYRGTKQYSREMAGVYARGRLLELQLGAKILMSPQAGWVILESQKELIHEVVDPAQPQRTLKFIAHPDFIAVHPPDKTEYVIECKSVNFHSRVEFLTLVTPTSKYEYPKDTHVLQANFYAYLLKKPFRIIYINAGDLSSRGFSSNPALPSKELFDVIINRGIKLDKMLMENTTPEGLMNWSCKFGRMRYPKTYCPAFNWCHAIGNYGPVNPVHAHCYKCGSGSSAYQKRQNPFVIWEKDFQVDELGSLKCPKCGGNVAKYDNAECRHWTGATGRGR